MFQDSTNEQQSPSARRCRRRCLDFDRRCRVASSATWSADSPHLGVVPLRRRALPRSGRRSDWSRLRCASGADDAWGRGWRSSSCSSRGAGTRAACASTSMTFEILSTLAVEKERTDRSSCWSLDPRAPAASRFECAEKITINFLKNAKSIDFWIQKQKQPKTTANNEKVNFQVKISNKNLFFCWFH